MVSFKPRRREEPMYEAKRRWYLTKGDKLVPEGHPEAAFLLVGAGCQLPTDQAQKYSLPEVEARLDAPPAPPEVPVAKAVAPVKDKARKPAADKSKKSTTQAAPARQPTRAKRGR